MPIPSSVALGWAADKEHLHYAAVQSLQRPLCAARSSDIPRKVDLGRWMPCEVNGVISWMSRSSARSRKCGAARMVGPW